MRKKIMYILTFCIMIVCCLFFNGCGSEDVQYPIVSAVKLNVKYDENTGKVNYTLKWTAMRAIAKCYKIVYDDKEVTVNDACFLINDFAPDVVHTIKIITVTEDGNENPHPKEVKFKGKKLDTPANFKMSDNLFHIEWDEVEECYQTYRLIFSDVELDDDTSTPIKTGTSKNIIVRHDFGTIFDIQEVFKNHDLSSVQNVAIQALPYKGIETNIADSKIIEFLYPSDISSDSVNLYAAKAVTPINVSWDDMDNFSNHRTLTIKWNNITSGHKFAINTKHSITGNVSTYYTRVGATSYNISFPLNYDNSLQTSGYYTVTVEPYCGSFSHLTENSYTFYIYEDEPVEELKYNLNQVKLETPSVRIDGENVYWDDIDYVERYYFGIVNNEAYLKKNFVESGVSLKELFNYFDGSGNVNLGGSISEHKEGVFDLIVGAKSISPTLESFENNIPCVNVYYKPDDGYSEDKIKLRPINPVFNVIVDHDNNSISWECDQDLEGYIISLFNESGFGSIYYVDSNINQYQFNRDISDYARIEIVARCEFELEKEGSVITMIIPSKYTVQIQSN